MTAQQLQELFLSQPSYRELLRQLENRGTTVGLDSLVGSSYSLVAAGAVRERGGVHVFVMEDRDAAGYLYNDLSPFLDEERLLFFRPPTNVRSNSGRKILRASCSAPLPSMR